MIIAVNYMFFVKGMLGLGVLVAIAALFIGRVIPLAFGKQQRSDLYYEEYVSQEKPTTIHQGLLNGYVFTFYLDANGNVIRRDINGEIVLMNNAMKYVPETMTLIANANAQTPTIYILEPIDKHENE